MSYRNNRPTSRSGEAEPAAAPPTPEPQRPVAPLSSSASRSKRSERSEHRGGKKPFKLALLVAALLLIAAVVWFVFGRGGTTSSAIDSGKYQVVVLRDSFDAPTYFGKLSIVNDDYMRLTNVFYLNRKTDTDGNTTTQSLEKQSASDFELIKLGNEIHGPEDEIIIPSEQILYFENLKPSGTVSKTISDYQTKQK